MKLITKLAIEYAVSTYEERKSWGTPTRTTGRAVKSAYEAGVNDGIEMALDAIKLSESVGGADNLYDFVKSILTKKVLDD